MLLGNILPAKGQSAIDQFVNQSILKNALISISVVDLNNQKVMHSHMAGHPITPASTLKLITTATVLEKLGSQYRYQTTVAYKGKINNSILTGDIIIVGSGDPSLASSKIDPGKEKNPRTVLIDQWVKKIKAAGISRINGNIVVDISCIDTVGVNPKWTWDDIGNYYAPGIYGISYLDNALKVTFKTGKIGDLAVIKGTDPKLPEMAFKNSVRGTETKSDNAYFFGVPGENLRYVSGEIPANRDSFVVKCDIPKPALLLANDIKSALVASGVKVEGTAIQTTNSIKNAIPIFTHESPELIDIITETNMKSNNHFAEYLFRTIAMQNQKPATIQGAIKEINSFWKSKGLPMNQLFLKDGSGLSPNNAVSAEFYTDLLVYMYTKSKYSADFVKSLPVSGRSGSMAGVLKGTKLQGKVWAKSGTIDNVKAYAGYLIDGEKKLAFAVIVNNAAGNSWQVLTKIEDFLLNL